MPPAAWPTRLCVRTATTCRAQATATASSPKATTATALPMSGGEPQARTSGSVSQPAIGPSPYIHVTPHTQVGKAAGFVTKVRARSAQQAATFQ